MITCATMCLVWNGLLTNYVCYRLCVMFGCVGMASYFVTCLNHMVQEGTFVRETLALQAGTVYS
jgi:hypothetical protein